VKTLRVPLSCAAALAAMLISMQVLAEEFVLHDLTTAPATQTAPPATQPTLPAEPLQDAPPPADEKGPPLPFITIEGQGGGAITPMAYLVNPAPEGKFWGKPSLAFDMIGLNGKNLDTFMVTENILGRLEFGFAADDLGLGTLPGAIQRRTKVDIGRSDVWLYNFSVRGLLIKENACDNDWIPAVTTGVIFKTNDGIRQINEDLGGALSGIGYSRENSEDFTLTLTKTFKDAFFGKPLILTAGLRDSQAAELGFLGFSDTYHASFEGSVAVLPLDRWLFAYEFRQKSSPYGNITIDDETIIGGENNWHAFDAAFIINKRATLVAGAGIFGNLANANANSAWWLQLKYEF
jgi:hypothetical protein